MSAQSPRRRPRWMGAILGALLFPLDPLLGLVLMSLGLFRPRRKP